jgi:aminoglycoside phosphotransferase (APT) family kinase protein
MQEIVKKIVEQELNARVTLSEEIVGKGKNNLVFKITTEKGICILRLQNSQKELETYRKEKWCADVAKNAGIPTPEILSIGVCGEYAFSIQEYVEGTRGIDAKTSVSEIWHTLGQYAKIFNQIPAPELTFNHVSFLQALFVEDFFTAGNIFSQEVSSKIQDRLKETTEWEFIPKLCHGNLHPSNVILSVDGVVHLIDWETATGNRTPQSELAEIYTWNTGKENVAHFLAGYGLKEDEVEAMMRDIQTLVLLRLVDVIRRKVVKGEAWKVDTYIQETAKRLAEIQDYQEDILFTKNLV